MWRENYENDNPKVPKNNSFEGDLLTKKNRHQTNELKWAHETKETLLLMNRIKVSTVNTC